MMRLIKLALCLVMMMFILSSVSVQSGAMLAIGDATGTFPDEATSMADENGNIVSPDSDDSTKLFLSTILPIGILAMTLCVVASMTIYFRQKDKKTGEIPNSDSETPDITNQ